MIFQITSVSEVVGKPALEELLLEYYTIILQKFAAIGGQTIYTPHDILSPFWLGLPKLLPPTGRLLLVHDEQERLVGCATLQQSRPDAGN